METLFPINIYLFHKISFSIVSTAVSLYFSLIKQFKEANVLKKISYLPIQYIKKILSFFPCFWLLVLLLLFVAFYHHRLLLYEKSIYLVYPLLHNAIPSLISCAQIYEKWKFSSSNFLLDKELTSFSSSPSSASTFNVNHVPVKSCLRRQKERRIRCRQKSNLYSAHIFFSLAGFLHIKVYFPFDIF